MQLSLGFSPCPNDTFIFDALVHGRVDTEGLSFAVHLADVEELNRRAFAGELDVTKLSYHAYGHLIKQYQLLNAGSALGRGVGPLLVTADRDLYERVQARPQAKRQQVPTRSAMQTDDDISQLVAANAPVAIPGRYTTANYLLGLALPHLTDKREVLFSDIEQRVLSGEFTAGLLIHENRFTYHERGLHKLLDLGDYWERQTQQPIPLGGIVARRDLPNDVIAKMDRVLARSVAHAFAHPDDSADYVAAHAQEMDPEVRRQHIQLYVNEYTRSLGVAGHAAVDAFLRQGRKRGVLPNDGIIGFHDPLKA